MTDTRLTLTAPPVFNEAGGMTLVGDESVSVTPVRPDFTLSIDINSVVAAGVSNHRKIVEIFVPGHRFTIMGPTELLAGLVEYFLP